MSITISDAVGSLRPNTNFSIDNGKIVAWDISEDQSGETQPTTSEIDAEMKRLETEYDALAWKKSREAEYPSLLELTVALYDTDDKSAIEAKRAAVKAKYPKPE